MRSNPHLLVALILLFTSPLRAEPTTTIITHGFSTDTKGDWVQSMAEAIVARAAPGTGSIYRYAGATGAWTHVPTAVSGSDSDVIVLIFNWVPESDGPTTGPNLNYAQAAADALYAMLRAPTFLGSPNPKQLPADLVTNRIVHFIGHSRGACVNSETALRLANAEIPVDQLTTLDPHPVNGTLDSPFNLNWGDPVPKRWANVTWADNCWRADGGGIINGLDFDGIILPDSFNTLLSESALNCCAYSFAHLDVHLWYHGTIDLAPNPCDGDQCITNQMRQTWWPEGYNQRGFYYSYLGGGSAERPNPASGPASPTPTSILYNGAFDQGTYAGWLSHGGSIAGQIIQESGNWSLRLGPAAASTATHNRFFLPTDAATLTFRVKVTTAAANESLNITLNEIGGPSHLLGSISLNAVIDWTNHELSIDSSIPPDALCTLTFQIATVGSIEAVIRVDDIAFTLQPAVPGDITGDFIVDVDDLLAVINAWGNCVPPCPADLTTNGVVDVDDLLIVINNWT